MKSVLTTSNPIRFFSELNKPSDFKNTHYTKGIYFSEKPNLIKTTDKVHLKCDCLGSSIVNGTREQILFALFQFKRTSWI